MYRKILLLTMVLSALLGGCAHVTETVKVLWGSSTKALEAARTDALTRTYTCRFQECYDAVLALAYQDDRWLAPAEETTDSEPSAYGEGENVKKPKPAGHFAVFIKNPKKRHIIVIGVPGSVDTTEVGIFFEELSDSTVKLDVASLSSSAKRTVSEIVFSELDLKFTAVN